MDFVELFFRETVPFNRHLCICPFKYLYLCIWRWRRSCVTRGRAVGTDRAPSLQSSWNRNQCSWCSGSRQAYSHGVTLHVLATKPSPGLSNKPSHVVKGTVSKDFNPSIFFTKLTPGQSIFVYDINFAEILPEPECIFNSVQIANRTKLLQVSVFLCRKLSGLHCILNSVQRNKVASDFL